MQAKMQDKKRAIELRKQGLSYSEIQSQVPVSQASLSLWLHEIKLSKKHQLRLTNKSLIGQRAGAAARRSQRLQKLNKLIEEVKRELPALLRDPFFTLGLSLYWAEGTKEKPWRVSARTVFTNSDPLAIEAMRHWLMKYGHVASEDFGYRIYIHASVPAKPAINKWADLLNVEPHRFAVSIKKHVILSRHKHENYKGLVQMAVKRSTWLNRRIELWIQGAAQHFLQLQGTTSQTHPAPRS